MYTGSSVAQPRYTFLVQVHHMAQCASRVNHMSVGAPGLWMCDFESDSGFPRREGREVKYDVSIMYRLSIRVFVLYRTIFYVSYDGLYLKRSFLYMYACP